MAVDHENCVEEHEAFAHIYFLNDFRRRRQFLQVAQTAFDSLGICPDRLQVSQVCFGREAVNGNADQAFNERAPATHESAESMTSKRILPGLVVLALAET